MTTSRAEAAAMNDNLEGIVSALQADLAAANAAFDGLAMQFAVARQDLAAADARTVEAVRAAYRDAAEVVDEHRRSPDTAGSGCDAMMAALLARAGDTPAR